jgi:DNA-binding MarR family transcriptional regulator
MNTADRLAAVDSSLPAWQAGVADLSSRDVILMRLIRVASLGITSCVDTLLLPAGLTESSYHTLIVVMASGATGITPGQLCEQVGQTHANMTRILSLLASEKLVTAKTDRRDARRKRIVITRSGRRLAQKHAAKLAPVVAAAMSGLSDEDKVTFERLLRAIVASMAVTGSSLGMTE